MRYDVVSVLYTDGIAFKFFPTAQQPYNDKAAMARAFFLRTLALGSVADVVSICRTTR